MSVASGPKVIAAFTVVAVLWQCGVQTTSAQPTLHPMSELSIELEIPNSVLMLSDGQLASNNNNNNNDNSSSLVHLLQLSTSSESTSQDQASQQYIILNSSYEVSQEFLSKEPGTTLDSPTTPKAQQHTNSITQQDSNKPYTLMEFQPPPPPPSLFDTTENPLLLSHEPAARMREKKSQKQTPMMTTTLSTKTNGTTTNATFITSSTLSPTTTTTPITTTTTGINTIKSSSTSTEKSATFALDAIIKELQSRGLITPPTLDNNGKTSQKLTDEGVGVSSQNWRLAGDSNDELVSTTTTSSDTTKSHMTGNTMNARSSSRYKANSDIGNEILYKLKTSSSSTDRSTKTMSHGSSTTTTAMSKNSTSTRRTTTHRYQKKQTTTTPSSSLEMLWETKPTTTKPSTTKVWIHVEPCPTEDPLKELMADNNDSTRTKTTETDNKKKKDFLLQPVSYPTGKGGLSLPEVLTTASVAEILYPASKSPKYEDSVHYARFIRHQANVELQESTTDKEFVEHLEEVLGENAKWHEIKE